MTIVLDFDLDSYRQSFKKNTFSVKASKNYGANRQIDMTKIITFCMFCERSFPMIITLFLQAIGQWSEWGDWGTCSKECDNGIQERNRTCITPNGVCVGDDTQDRLCNTQKCPGKIQLNTSFVN